MLSQSVNPTAVCIRMRPQTGEIGSHCKIFYDIYLDKSAPDVKILTARHMVSDSLCAPD
jgi:hypothetical protein